jgi:hypothetical protein
MSFLKGNMLVALVVQFNQHRNTIKFGSSELSMYTREEIHAKFRRADLWLMRPTNCNYRDF